MLHVQYTQRHSPDASLPSRACSVWFEYLSISAKNPWNISFFTLFSIPSRFTSDGPFGLQLIEVSAQVMTHHLDSLSSLSLPSFSVVFVPCLFILFGQRPRRGRWPMLSHRGIFSFSFFVPPPNLQPSWNQKGCDLIYQLNSVKNHDNDRLSTSCDIFIN